MFERKWENSFGKIGKKEFEGKGSRTLSYLLAQYITDRFWLTKRIAILKLKVHEAKLYVYNSHFCIFINLNLMVLTYVKIGPKYLTS